DNIDEFIITEKNILNSPLVKLYDDGNNIFEHTKLYEKYHKTNNKEALSSFFRNLINDKNYGLNNYIDVYSLIRKKLDHIDVRQNTVNSNIQSIFHSVIPKNGMINTNLLSIAFFQASKELDYNIQMYIVTDGKDLFKLFPMISDWNRYIIADLHVNKGDYIEGSPIVFDDVVEARAYVMSRFVADDEEKKIFMTTDDVPSTIGADTIFSNDSDLMKLFLSDIEDKTETVNEMLSEEFILNEAIKISDKRTDIQDTIMKVFDKLDKSGKNSEKLKNFYNTMNNEEFIRYMKRFVNSDENFYLEVLPNKNEPKLKDVEEALEAINVPTNEYVYYQHDGDKSNPIRTRYQVPVG